MALDLGEVFPLIKFVRAIRQDPRNANLLYAGTNRGVWVSLDGGARWQSLRLNMPATAIYDLEIQPDANDLVVAAHGRGAWILDDLTVLQSWSHATSSPVVLFAPRDTYRMWQWAPLNTFTEPKIPPNEYVGENPDYGALLTYYFAREPETRHDRDRRFARARRSTLNRRRRSEGGRHEPHELGSRRGGSGEVDWDV